MIRNYCYTINLPANSDHINGAYKIVSCPREDAAIVEAVLKATQGRYWGSASAPIDDDRVCFVRRESGHRLSASPEEILDRLIVPSKPIPQSLDIGGPTFFEVGLAAGQPRRPWVKRILRGGGLFEVWESRHTIRDSELHSAGLCWPIYREAESHEADSMDGFDRTYHFPEHVLKIIQQRWEINYNPIMLDANYCYQFPPP